MVSRRQSVIGHVSEFLVRVKTDQHPAKMQPRDWPKGLLRTSHRSIGMFITGWSPWNWSYRALNRVIVPTTPLSKLLTDLILFIHCTLSIWWCDLCFLSGESHQFNIASTMIVQMQPIRALIQPRLWAMADIRASASIFKVGYSLRFRRF
jgi:hypothetical protein